MMNKHLKNVFIKSLLLLGVILSTSTVKAQLTGTLTIPTDYSTIADFVTDLNAQGVGSGGVILDIPSGYTETAPAGGYTITASGTTSDQIIITCSGAVQPLISASASLTIGALNDAIFKIIGGDYITISNLNLQENAANSTTAAATNNMTEWGVALLYLTTTDGAQNCSIIGNTIILKRVYQNTFGIYSNSTHSASAVTTSISATTTSGGNSGLKIHANNISNVNNGIIVVGPTAAVDHNNVIDIGGTSLSTGNTITNYGTTSTFSAYANVSGTVNGVLVRNSKNVNLSYNTITSSVGGVVAGTLNGIQFPSFSNSPTGAFIQTISNNQISLNSGILTGGMNGINIGGTSASVLSTINVTDNNFVNFDHSTATASGSITFITQGGTHLTQSISNNTFTNINVKTTGSVTFISNSHSLPAGGSKNVNGNSIVTAFTKTGAGGTITLFTDNGSDPSGAINNSNNNNFSTINVTGATTIAGFSNTNGGTPTKSVTGNTFSNWTGGTSAITALVVSFSGISNVSGNLISNISSAGSITGITSGSGAETFTGNSVHSLTSTGASAVTGISNTGGTAKNFNGNKIYNLEVDNAGGSVNGILVSAGTTVRVSNNLISNLRAPNTSAADVIRGISITSTSTSSTIAVQYNSIYLNATSTGVNFGTTGIFHTINATGTTAALDLRNNIIINESTANGTGLTVSYRRSAVGLNNYATTSNRNLFYAGIPSASNLIFTDGTNPQASMFGFQTFVGPRELNSFTGESAFTALGYGTPTNFFISLTGSSSDFLRPMDGITTQVESGAENISGITTDFSNVIRAGNLGYLGTGTNPDLGAYEIEALSPAPVITLNSVTPPTVSQCVASNRLISMDVTTLSGTITVVNLGYTVNGVPQGNISMTNTSGSTWEATLPIPSPANALIAWGVSATNSLGLSSSYTGTSYSDEPLTGATASATASLNILCAGEPTSLSANLSKSGSSVSGIGSGTSSSSGISPFYHGYGGVKTQYIFRASELTAMGFSAGNITSIALNVTVLGTPTLNSFSINVGHTAQNAAIANTAILSGLTEVYNSAAQTLSLGANAYNFSTPFNWDGLSNIVLSFNYSNVNTGGSSTTVTTDPALAFTSSLAIYADNATAACLFSAPSSGQACMGTNSNTTSSVRPTITFTGNKSPLITSVQWMDGATPVGTGNPLSVNPAVTTTYTANITSSGCTFTPSPTVNVTVNPLPTAPTAANSAQCGTQIPTASVTSTSGLPTPTFIWYDAAIAGTAMQNSVSTTYTSNVATTTTFYVAEVNTVTSCESTRTPITVTVAIADGITASANNASICVGSSVIVSVVNNNATPNQSYSYTWTNGQTGSGLVSQNGSSLTITPTQTGTYTYDVVGVDGGCSAVSSIIVTVDPYTATLSPIDLSCTGSNDGSFSITSETCGTASTYSVDGGAFGAIPTNLSPGIYGVVVQNSLGYQTGPISVTINEPAPVIAPIGITSIAVCQNDASAQLIYTPISTGTITIPFDLLAQPTEVSNSTVGTVAVNPNIISSATMPSLPTNAVVTGITFTFNNITALGGSWRSDINFGFNGALTSPYAIGSGAPSSAGTFNYTIALAPGSVSIVGGVINLHYFDQYNDNAGSEATFPTGASVASMVINYTYTPAPSVAYYAAPTGGASLGSGSPFETVGTTVLPNTITPGVYNFYAEGINGVCTSANRTLVTVTVKANSFSTTPINACNSYTWTNGTTYTTSGTYTQVLPNANGCDSTAILNLTINNSTTSSSTATACDSYTLNGTTYTTSGIYTQVLTNAAGCDSTLTLTLTINNSTNSSTIITVCDSYTWTNGTNYTASGTFTQVLTNAAGCDSTATLVLTIKNSSTSSTLFTACDSYTWTNGTTYTLSGTYIQVLTNAVGCDSTAILVLTINNSTTSSLTVTACDTYTLNTTTYTASGTYTQVLTNAAGCDSTITLMLTIDNSTTSSTTITACDTYLWTNGNTYTTSGIFTQVLTNAAGCDSIATLNLTINVTPSATATDNGDATITASVGTNYQWINCATMLPISGEIAQTFTATSNGSYAVEVSNGTCSNTSSCVVINYIGILEFTKEVINLYPNPTRDNVTISMSSVSAKVEIVDAQGKTLETITIQNGGLINLTNYDRGVYFLRVTTDGGTTIHSIVKN